MDRYAELSDPPFSHRVHNFQGSEHDKNESYVPLPQTAAECRCNADTFIESWVNTFHRQCTTSADASLLLVLSEQGEYKEHDDGDCADHVDGCELLGDRGRPRLENRAQARELASQVLQFF